MQAYNEYQKFSELLENNEYSPEDIYIELMKKEGNVLKVINRITKTKQEEDIEKIDLMKLPLESIIFNLINTLRSIFHELVLLMTTNEFSFQHFKNIFTSYDRLFYVGIFIIIVTMFYFFIDSSK